MPKMKFRITLDIEYNPDDPYDFLGELQWNADRFENEINNYVCRGKADTRLECEQVSEY